MRRPLLAYHTHYTSCQGQGGLGINEAGTMESRRSRLDYYAGCQQTSPVQEAPKEAG